MRSLCLLLAGAVFTGLTQAGCDVENLKSQAPVIEPLWQPPATIASRGARIWRSLEKRALVRLPDYANGVMRVEDEASAMAIEVVSIGAASVPADIAGDHVVYAGALGPGGDSLYRVTESGVEDWIRFGAAPAREEITYAVDVSRVAGLRLVTDSLEFLDAGGTPRLRIAPPRVIGADGAQVDARLWIEGCAYDASPAAPWGREVTPPGRSRCVVRVNWSEPAIAYPALVDPLWQTTGSMATVRTRHAASLLANGQVLVTGGEDQLNIALSSAELYDPVTGTWAATMSMSTARSRHTSTRLLTDKVLVVSTDTSELYDPVGGAWTDAGAPLLIGPVNYTASLLQSGKVLMNYSGGAPSRGIYDPAGSGSWQAVSGPGEAIYDHTASVLPDGRVVVAGGYYQFGVALSHLHYIHDPSMGTWSPLPSPITRRRHHTASVLPSGKVMIAGGIGASGDPLIVAEIYDPATNTWTPTGGMMVARTCHTASELPMGKVLVVGGDSAELYDPQLEAFLLAETLAEARCWHTATVLADGGVLIAGGNGLASAELFSLLDDGTACTDGEQCKSGQCVDLVCCDSPCAGFCRACSAAAKGQGSDGVCEFAALGADPDDECQTIGPEGFCQVPGTCNGSGACATQDGKDCKAPECSGLDEQTNLSICDAFGNCVEQGTTTCTPYVCADGECKTECAADVDCAGAYACVAGQCVPAEARCNGDSLLTSMAGVITDCAPYKCVPGGTCKTRCDSVLDCAAPNACNLDHICVARVERSTEDAGSCSAGAHSEERPAWLFIAVGLAIAAAARRRQKS